MCKVDAILFEIQSVWFFILDGAFKDSFCKKCAIFIFFFKPGVWSNHISLNYSQKNQHFIKLPFVGGRFELRDSEFDQIMFKKLVHSGNISYLYITACFLQRIIY